MHGRIEVQAKRASELKMGTADHALVERAYDPKEIVAEINATGFSVVKNYIAPSQLKLAQDFALAAVKKSPANCTIFRGPGALSGTFMHELPADPDFVKLCCNIYEEGTGEKARDTRCYQVLRCLSGPSGRRNSMRFHFDSHVLAALIPVIIPADGTPGDLLLIPNLRKIRKSYALNLIDKAILASPFQQRRLKNMYIRGDERLIHVKLIPGNLYFFWGYTSAHTNEQCNLDKVRSTALFHYVDPHAASGLKRIMPVSRLKTILHPTRMTRPVG